MGVNYLEVCRRAAVSDPLAKDLLEGLESVLARQTSEFHLEYHRAVPTRTGGSAWPYQRSSVPAGAQ